MEYIAFMHNNSDAPAAAKEWDAFFSAARKSGMFRGGSEIGHRTTLGKKPAPDLTESINGYMVFEAESLQSLHILLRSHPVFANGGTIEICELPKSR